MGDALWYGLRLWFFMAAICLYLLHADLSSAPEFIVCILGLKPSPSRRNL